MMKSELEEGMQKKGSSFEVKILRVFAWISLIGGLLVTALTAIGVAQANLGGGFLIVSTSLPWLFGSLLSFALLMAVASITDNLQAIRETVGEAKRFH